MSIFSPTPELPPATSFLAQAHKLASPTAIRAWPVDPPTAIRERNPEKRFRRRRPHVVVECGGTLVKSPRVGSIPESEPFAVQVVAKLVAERREKRADRGDSLLDGRAHPDADQLLFQMVVPEKLRRPTVFPHAQRAGCQDSNLWP